MFHPAHSLHVPLCSAESRCFVNIARLSLTLHSFPSLSSPIFDYLFSTTFSLSLSLTPQTILFFLLLFLSQTSLSITFALYNIQSLTCPLFRFLARQKNFPALNHSSMYSIPLSVFHSFFHSCSPSPLSVPLCLSPLTPSLPIIPSTVFCPVLSKPLPVSHCALPPYIPPLLFTCYLFLP